jgi:acyl carrier protein
MNAPPQTVTPDDIRALITQLLVDEFDIAAERLHDAATMTDLDLDSLDMVEIGQVVEARFGTRIKMADAQGISDFGGIIQMIHRKIEGDRTDEQDGTEDSQ